MIKIICVGKIKEKYLRDAIEEYKKRLSKYTKLEIIEVNDIDNQNIDNVSMNILSMGMTGDYMVAIEEGATMVRVGTGIFGERNYKQKVEN